MDYYYKYINENGETIGVISYSPNKPNITDPFIVEIEQEEFETYLAEINKPDEPTGEISAEEALNIILGGEQV